MISQAVSTRSATGCGKTKSVLLVLLSARIKELEKHLQKAEALQTRRLKNMEKAFLRSDQRVCRPSSSQTTETNSSSNKGWWPTQTVLTREPWQLSPGWTATGSCVVWFCISEQVCEGEGPTLLLILAYYSGVNIYHHHHNTALWTKI